MSESKKIQVCLVGGKGRVGQILCDLILKSTKFKVTAIVDNGVVPHGNNQHLKDATECVFMSDIPDIAVDLVIDFSSPDMTVEALNWSVKQKVAFLSGTTGLSEGVHQKLREASSKIPVLWSANMSVGIALLTKMLRVLSSAEGFDIQVQEIHHKRKVDAPSGTALHLQRVIESTVGRALPQPTSVRGGGLFGEHQVLIMGEEEWISLEHHALNRTVFARGALQAAEFLFRQPPGLYSFEEVMDRK